MDPLAVAMEVMNGEIPDRCEGSGDRPPFRFLGPVCLSSERILALAARARRR